MTAPVSISDQLFHFTDDLERTLGYDPGWTLDCDDILLCGVGGSAVSGDIATDCCFRDSRVRVRSIRYPVLPRWAGPRTLVVASSYSGNTAETLEMYRQAVEKGCEVLVLTSGGKMRSMAESRGDRLILLPEGMHPRHAIGYMIGYTLAAIRAAGGPDLSEEIRGFIPGLRGYRDAVSGDEGLAMGLARSFVGRTPVVCCDGFMRSVSFRWKTQVNENSKYVAFCESVPQYRKVAEDIAASGGSPAGYIFVILSGCDDGFCTTSSEIREVAERLASSGADVRIIELGGGSALENMFRAIILGDYASVYTANIRGIDPSEVRPVMQLKAKLSSAGL